MPLTAHGPKITTVPLPHYNSALKIISFVSGILIQICVWISAPGNTEVLLLSEGGRLRVSSTRFEIYNLPSWAVLPANSLKRQFDTLIQLLPE